jgi:Fe-S cluster assembly iron-binding protein IscA
MDVAEGPGNGDVTIEKGGTKVFIEKKAGALLAEATIDFDDEQGFIISGTQQTSCCG